MNLWRKPSSDKRTYNDQLHAHVHKCLENPRPVWAWWDTERRQPDVSAAVRFSCRLGYGGRRLVDIAVDVRWDDVCVCIDKLAEIGDSRAIQLQKLIKDR